eukprot:2809883-Rhodomonas_salina.2
MPYQPGQECYEMIHATHIADHDPATSQLVKGLGRISSQVLRYLPFRFCYKSSGTDRDIRLILRQHSHQVSPGVSTGVRFPYNSARLAPYASAQLAPEHVPGEVT